MDTERAADQAATLELPFAGFADDNFDDTKTEHSKKPLGSLI